MIIITLVALSIKIFINLKLFVASKSFELYLLKELTNTN